VTAALPTLGQVNFYTHWAFKRTNDDFNISFSGVKTPAVSMPVFLAEEDRTNFCLPKIRSLIILG
jgi:hypothetical protein